MNGLRRLPFFFEQKKGSKKETFTEKGSITEYAEYIKNGAPMDYSGWRPQELGLLELKNVDLINWTFKGGMKTDAGIDRVVPIHSKIRCLVERKYKETQELGR